MLEKLKKNSVILIFGIFFMIVLLQHSFVFLYHDDYAYASLSYGYYVEGVNGTDFTVNQLFEFLIGHYMKWGGRILTFFYEICLISHNLWEYRIVQSMAITLIFYYIYKISKKVIGEKLPNWAIALCSVLCYGIFEVFMFRTCIFWASASVSYVTPMLPFLIFIYYYDQIQEKKFKNKFLEILSYIFLGICIFLASFSQEQIGLAAFSYVAVLTIYKIIKNKKINKLDIIMSIISLIGLAILILAPGNEIRKSHPTSIQFYSLPLFERIVTGTKNLILGNFSPEYTRIFTIIFYFVVLYYSLKCIIEKIGVSIISTISFISTLIITFISIFNQNWYFKFMLAFAKNNEIANTCLIFLFVIQIGLMFYSISVYFMKKQQLKLVNILISIVLSQGCMVIAPYFEIRSSIMFNLLFFIIIVYTVYNIYMDISNKKIFACLVIPFVMLSLYNICDITYGYYSNNSTNIYNDDKLKNVSQEIKEGKNIEEVQLKKLPNYLYGGEQPYVEGDEYILYFMREYYDLPDDLKIYYE